MNGFGCTRFPYDMIFIWIIMKDCGVPDGQLTTYSKPQRSGLQSDLTWAITLPVTSLSKLNKAQNA